jgi:hypothetical protein
VALKQLAFLNAEQPKRFFPKMLNVARKRLFTTSSSFHETLRKKDSLYEFADNMRCCYVAFLDPRGCLGIYDQGELADLSQFTSTTSCQAQGVKAPIAGGLHGKKHIFRVAAGADSPGDIVFLAEGHDLLGKDFIKRKVIGNAGQHRGVGSEGHRRQGLAVYGKTINEFCRNVLGIGSAASIAKDQKLVAGSKAGRQSLGHREEAIHIGLDKTFVDPNALFHGL